MTESVLSRQRTLNPKQAQEGSILQTWMRRLVWKIAIATLMLMAVGSATRGDYFARRLKAKPPLALARRRFLKIERP